MVFKYYLQSAFDILYYHLLWVEKHGWECTSISCNAKTMKWQTRRAEQMKSEFKLEIQIPIFHSLEFTGLLARAAFEDC